jgi:hypothetical protein
MTNPINISTPCFNYDDPEITLAVKKSEEASNKLRKFVESIIPPTNTQASNRSFPANETTSQPTTPVPKDEETSDPVVERPNPTTAASLGKVVEGVTPTETIAGVTSPSETPPSLHKFSKIIEWMGEKYLLEQELDSSTTPEEWEQIANVYQMILHSADMPPECRPGIKTFNLSFNADLLIIEIPDQEKNISVRNQMVSDLYDFYTKKEKTKISFYQTEKTPQPPKEEPSMRAPIGITNRTQTDCHANALAQMIYSNPHLATRMAVAINKMEGSQTKEAFAKFGLEYQRAQESLESPKPDGRLLRSALFPGEEPSEQDIIETLENLRQAIGDTETNPLQSEMIVQTTFHQAKGLPIQTYSEPEKTLPLIPLTPSKTSKNASSALYQYCLEEEKMIFTTAPQTLMIASCKTRSGTDREKMFFDEKLFLPKTLIKSGNGALYQLRSFAVHRGEDGHGHYLAYVRVKQDDQTYHYYEISDETREEISYKQFIEASGDGYLAFYEKITPPDRETREMNRDMG